MFFIAFFIERKLIYFSFDDIKLFSKYSSVKSILNFKYDR
jgi:hypothetical protein